MRLSGIVFTLVVVAILKPGPGLGQQAEQRKIDSLLVVLKSAKEDTNKANALLALHKSVVLLNRNDSSQYGWQALRLSEKLNFTKGLLRLIYLLAKLALLH